MATRSKPATTDEITSDEAEFLSRVAQRSLSLPDEPEETSADRVARMLAGLDGDERAKVVVHRVIGPNKYSWCGEFSPGDFEAGGNAMIRDKWGAGEFQVRLYATQPGSGLFGIRAKENILIEKDHAPSIAQQPAHAPGLSPDVVAILASMQESQNRMMAALSERVPPVDPFAQMASMMGMMKTMREVMGPTEQPKTEKSSISEIMEAIREIKAVSGEINGDNKEPADPLTAALPQMLELISGANKAQQPQALSFPPVTLPPSIAENPAGRSMTDDAAISQSDMIEKLRASLSGLCMLASSGAEVETGANVVWETAPDEIIAVLKEPEWFSQLKLFAPEAAPYEAWFLAVGARVLEIEREESEADARDPHEAGPLQHP